MSEYFYTDYKQTCLHPSTDEIALGAWGSLTTYDLETPKTLIVNDTESFEE